MSELFRITLRDVDGHEGIAVRQFDLALGATFPIGRSSRNATKPDLLPAAHNAYINSPVISRDHAILSANADSGVPSVYIKDVGSMHGTMVNGQRLQPDTPKQLFTGDLLQFGIDVNRNEEFYVARKYIAETHLIGPQAPFSMGFTVPDSDEEDAGTTSPRRGSQDNPLTIDDSDNDSKMSDHGENDLTLAKDDLINRHQDSIESADVQTSYTQHKEPSMHPTVSAAHDSDDEDDMSSLQDHDEAEGLGYNFSSVSGSSEGYDDEASIDFGEEEEFMAEEGINDEEEEPSEAASDRSMAGSDLGDPTPDPKESQNIFASYPAQLEFRSDLSLGTNSSLAEPELPPLSMFRDSTNSNIYAPPPPLPPRPSDSRSQPNNIAQPSIWPSDSPYNPDWSEFSASDRRYYFLAPPALVPTHNADVEASTAYVFRDADSYMATGVSHMQTPPPITPPEKTFTTPPPPSRRTKVSIGEIVEEQPRTPESVQNTKRKADVLDEEDAPVAQEPAPTPTDLDAVAAANTAVADTAAIIAQRPIIQPRSIMRRLKQAATIFGFGTAGAVGALAALSSLPDTFFT